MTTSSPATVSAVRVPDERVRAFLGSSLVGALTILALHLQFVALWPALYSLHPWKGYETAMRQGWVSPGYLESPLAFRVAMVFLVILGAAAGLFPGARRLARFTGLSVGVVVAAGVAALFYADFRQSNLAPLAVVVLPVTLVPPLAVGFGGGSVLRKMRERKWSR